MFPDTRESEIERGGGHRKRVGSGRRETWVFVDLLGFYAYLGIRRERLDFHKEENLFEQYFRVLGRYYLRIHPKKAREDVKYTADAVTNAIL